jgi:DnaJ-class molecular chaperone
MKTATEWANEAEEWRRELARDGQVGDLVDMPCDECAGSGCECCYDGTVPGVVTECDHCDGKGWVVGGYAFNYGPQKGRVDCPRCHGAGKEVDPT